MFKSPTNLIVLLIITVLFVIMGCSSSTNPINPESAGSDLDGRDGNLGEFALTINPDNFTAEITPVNRTASLEVTGWVNIDILGLTWDEEERVWDVHISIENPSKYDAYGPWIVFRDTQDQVILDQDGFTTWRISPGGLTKRVPVYALAKENSQRIFPSNTTEYRHLKIHWPDSVNSWQSIYFIVDVSYPGPRQEAIIENLQIAPLTTPGQNSIVAYVKDWQTDNTTQPLNVAVDLTPIGGVWNEPMFDDGLHGDGVAGDDVWGTSFAGNPPQDPVVLTVMADDWEDYHFENDVIFVDESGIPPCEDTREIAIGGQSGIHTIIEEVFNDQVSWEAFWAVHGSNQMPPPPVPEVDFDTETVIALMVGNRSSSGFSIRVDCVRIWPDPYNLDTIEVEYTELIPGQSCMVMHVITQPFNFFAIPKVDEALGVFDDSQEVYECD